MVIQLETESSLIFQHANGDAIHTVKTCLQMIFQSEIWPCVSVPRVYLMYFNTIQGQFLYKNEAIFVRIVHKGKIHELLMYDNSLHYPIL